MKRKILINEEEKQNINNFLAQKDKFIIEGNDDKVYDFSLDTRADGVFGKQDFEFSTTEGLDNKDNIKTITTSTKTSVFANPATHAIVAECESNSEYNRVKRYVEDTFLSYYTKSSGNEILKEGPIVDILEDSIVTVKNHIEILREGENIEYYTNGTYTNGSLDDDNFKISKVPLDKLKETVSSKVLNGTFPMIYPHAKKYSLYEICLMLLNVTPVLGKSITRGKFGTFKDSSASKDAAISPILCYNPNDQKEYMIFCGISGPQQDSNGRYYAIFSDAETYKYSQVLSKNSASILPTLDIHYPAYYMLPIKHADIPSSYSEVVDSNDQSILEDLILKNLLMKVLN